MRKPQNMVQIMILALVILYAAVNIFIVNHGQKETFSNNTVLYYENVIAITFDDGPIRDTTERLLDGLKERDVRATFFVLGCNIVEKENEYLVKRMYDEGHLIGNHTYSHVQLNAMNRSAAVQEVKKANQVIKDITGEEPKYIRPPFGEYNNQLQFEINMVPVMWTVDPRDWTTTSVSSIVNAVVKNAKNGDIILLHDVYDTSVTAAFEIIDRLKERGFIFVTVDELMLD